MEFQKIASVGGEDDAIWSVAWSPDGTVLASCSETKIRLWSQKAGWKCIALLEGVQDRTVRRLAWSLDGTLLASSSFDGSVAVWKSDGSDGFRCMTTLEGHESEVKGVDFGHGGKYLATSGRDKTVWIWEAVEHDFECVAVLMGHTQDVKSVRFHPKYPILFSASYDGTIKVWKEGEDDWVLDQTLSDHKTTVWEIVFSGDGKEMLSCAQDGSLFLWDVNDQGRCGLKQKIVGLHKRVLYSVDWGTHIVTGGGDDAIQVIERDGMKIIARLERPHDGDVNCVRWNPKNEDMFASAGDDGMMHVWKRT